jgi:hypothetical protein
MLTSLTLPRIGIAVGLILSIVGLYAYATQNATLNLIGFFYGIPLLLGAIAFKFAELPPAPFSTPTPADIRELREKQATPTQNQVRKDVTRFRYGQKAHLDLALEKLGLAANSEEIPILVAIREEAVESRYALVLEFESPHFPLDTWTEISTKVAKFFGPNIAVKLANPQEDRIDVMLISQES